MENLSNNPSLLELLKQGAKVTFNDGFFLSGDPSTSYIQVGHEFGNEGLWILNEEGVENALNDIEKLREEHASEE